MASTIDQLKSLFKKAKKKTLDATTIDERIGQGFNNLRGNFRQQQVQASKNRADFARPFQQGASNVVGNFRAITNPQTGQDWFRGSPNTNIPYQAINTASKPIQWVGQGIGKAIVAPLESAFNTVENRTDQRLANTLRNQQSRAMSAGNLDVARNRARLIGENQQRQASRLTSFGNDINSIRKTTAAGALGAGLSALGVGAGTPTLAATAALSGGIGYGATKLTGGTNLQAQEALGQGIGKAPQYAGVNKITTPIITRMLNPVAIRGLGERLFSYGTANALANIAEDYTLSKASQEKMTSGDVLSSAGIGAVIGGVSGSSPELKRFMGKFAKKVGGSVDAQGFIRNKTGQLYDPGTGRWVKETASKAVEAVKNKQKQLVEFVGGNAYDPSEFNLRLRSDGFGMDLAPNAQSRLRVNPEAGFVNMGAPVAGMPTVKFQEPAVRGDITKLQNNLDEVLGTKSFNSTGKWQADLPARQTAKQQLQGYADQGEPEARKLLDYVNKLEDDIATAQISNQATTPKGVGANQRVPIKNPVETRSLSNPQVQDTTRSLSASPPQLAGSRVRVQNTAPRLSTKIPINSKTNTQVVDSARTNVSSKANLSGNQGGRIQLNTLQNPRIQVINSQPPLIGKTQLPIQSPLRSRVPIKTEVPVSGVPLNSSIPSQKQRGFTSSVQEAPSVFDPVKADVSGTYTPKPNDKLMGEAKALLQDGAKIDFKNTQNLDQKVAATIQEALNQQKLGNYEAAANLFNNLSEQGTELGRSVQAFSLLKSMTPEAIALSVAGKIKKYNLSAKKLIPELNGDQMEMITEQVKLADSLRGREKKIVLHQLKQTLDSLIPSTLADKLITTWKAGLLTSLRTHERNLVGNTMHQMGEIAKDYVASPVDQLLSFKTGRRTLTATTQGLGEAVSKQTRQQATDLVKLGFDPTEQINKFDIKRVTWGNNKFEQGLKIYTDAVFRTLGAADRPFYNAALARSLYDQAGAAAINAGKKGDGTFITNLVKNPTEEMYKIAVSDANIATFKDRTTASNVANAIKRSLSSNELAKFAGEFIMPFTGVPSSIFTQLKNYSPIGLTQGMIDAGRVLVGDVPQLQRQASQEIGRGVVGTAIMALGAYLMSRGLVTGQPKDQEESRQWELENKPRNSIYIGGKWRSLNSIGPEAFIFLSGAKLQEEMNKPDGSLGTYGASLGKDFLDQSFVTGIQQPVNAITDPARYGKSYAGNAISSFIPNIIKDSSKAFDGTAREANTVLDYTKMSVPGLRNTLTEKRDVLGNIIPQEPTGIAAFIDLFNSKTPRGSELVGELSRLYGEGYGATPSKLKKEQTINKKKYVLTPEQLNAYEAGVSQPLQSALEKLISSSAYASLTDEEKQKKVDKVVLDVRAEYKKTNADEIIVGAKVPVKKPTFQQTEDQPKNILDKVALAAQGIGVDPQNTIKAIFTQEELRKIEGNAVILKRQEFLNKENDPNLQRDHIIPLGLGGDNSDENLKYVPKDWHAAKTKNDNRLIRELQSGKITRQEAQEQVRTWIENNPHETYVMESEPTSESVKTNITEGSIINREFEIDNGVDKDGEPKTKTVKIEVPEYPTLTGQDELDKKLKSSYYSKLNTAKNNTLKLYEAGVITAEQAEEILGDLDTKQTKSSGKTGRKLKIKLGSTPTLKKVSIKAPQVSQMAKINFNIPTAPRVPVRKTSTTRPRIKLRDASKKLLSVVR